MTYDPYNDIKTLVNRAKTEGVSAEEVYDLLKRGQTYSKATKDQVSKEVKGTKDYITSGGAYKDAGAAAIRAAYADYADLEKGHTEAKIAGENGGNINSYAAAQANRTALDVLDAGEAAVKERAEQIYEGMQAQDKLLVQAAEMAIDGTEKAADTATELAGQSADTRKSALDTLLDFYGILKKA